MQLIPCNDAVSTLPHLNKFVVSADDTTLMSSIVILLQTVGLEQTTYPEYGEYFVLVVPWKFVILTLLIVRFDGN